MKRRGFLRALVAVGAAGAATKALALKASECAYCGTPRALHDRSNCRNCGAAQVVEGGKLPAPSGILPDEIRLLDAAGALVASILLPAEAWELSVEDAGLVRARVGDHLTFYCMETTSVVAYQKVIGGRVLSTSRFSHPYHLLPKDEFHLTLKIDVRYE